MKKSDSVLEGEKWLVANGAVEIVSLWYSEPHFIGVMSDGASVVVSERVPSLRNAFLEVSSEPEPEPEPEEVSDSYVDAWRQVVKHKKIIEECIAHIKSASDCEDARDYVMAAIELSKRL